MSFRGNANFPKQHQLLGFEMDTECVMCEAGNGNVYIMLINVCFTSVFEKVTDNNRKRYQKCCY